MGLDVMEHFYEPEPTEVTNHCHRMETNPPSPATKRVSGGLPRCGAERRLFK